jgi:N-acyl-D-aspartate/D-glutamate deacylase
MPVENIVAKLTSFRVNADLYVMKDRGGFTPGLRADLNLINLDELAVLRPFLVKDLLAAGSRLLQDAHGYRATFVGGLYDAPRRRRHGATAQAPITLHSFVQTRRDSASERALSVVREGTH